MRSWLLRFGFVLALVPIVASADTPPSVVFAEPGTNGSAITRFTMRFSEAMVPLGQGLSGRPPIRMACKVDGKGRWVDPTTYVWDFDTALPGDTICTAELRDGLTTLDGSVVGGTQRFEIDSGGPTPKAVLTGSSGDGIEEDQAFIVAVNGPVDRTSIAPNVYCTVDGIGERIPVDLLPSDTPGRLLSEMGSRWSAESFLEDAGLPSPLPASAKERDAALANVVALKCRRPLPPGRDMALVWGKNVRSPSGRIAGKETRHDYEVRTAFTARLSCSRVNANAGCNPLEPVNVRFSAEVPRAKALSLRLDLGGGKLQAPIDKGREATLSEVSFKPLLTPAITARLLVPEDLRDESGRALANGRRFPLSFEISATPPLVKFAAPFGILEAREGGVLPVTVRGVEPDLQPKMVGIAGASARIDADDRVIADWLRKIAKAQEDDIRDEGTEDKPKEVNYTGTTSLLNEAAGASAMSVPLPGKGKEFEVIGVPLGKPGFYVVELASPELGRVLLGRPATRYVSAAALVTDMTVHFKWGRAGSLAWVTSLSEGKPVAGAAIRVTDSCSGEQLAAGTTDKKGRLAIASGLPSPTSRSGCEHLGDSSPPLMISARKGGDFSFTMTQWSDGISPGDFELPYGWSEPEPILHTILDRTLLRAGEMVHMKHVYRMPTAGGFRSGGSLSGTLELSHSGSDTTYSLPLALDEGGIGESEWSPPAGAPSGDYQIRVRVGPPPSSAGDDEDADDSRETIYTGQSIRVEDYRLPTMRASVSGPKTASVRPRQLPLDLYVGYLSGGGARGAAVKLRTAWSTFGDAPDGWEGWTFGGRRIVEGTVPLDEDGSDGGESRLPDAATLPLALDNAGALRTPLEMPVLDDDAQLTVEMDYQDANGETLTASTRVPVYASAVRLGIESDGWVQRAGDMRLKVAALTIDGRPIRGQKVAIALYTREILSARRRLIGGFYAYDNVVETKRIAADCSGVSDDHGLIRCRLDPGVSGEVIAVATTTDTLGNEARAVTSLYLAGEDDWWFGGDNGDRMDIIADAKSYRSNDTARIQVRMPFRKATALVTVEREGVLSSFVTEISGKDPTISVPLAGSYAPDVYVSVMAVRGRVSSWKVWLAELAQEWNIPFLKQVANPTALVDLAKPSYRIGMTRLKVGWEGHRLDVAVRADKERYHVRDTAHAMVQVRGPGGKPPADAEIAFAAVDEALMVLSPNDSWKLLDAMMGERPLSVLTSTAQMQVVGKRHYGRKAVAAGGGGGGGGDLTDFTRTEFKPVLLWKGRVRLDEKGRAAVDVPLADSLSAYRLVAIATSGGDLFGTGSTQIRTVQDLTLYSGLPPLVRSGDEYGATFTLRNGSDRAMEVTASAAVDGKISVGGPQTVIIPAGGAAPVTWRLTAPDNVETLRWTVSARSADGRSADRIQVDEQVIPAVPVETWAATYMRVGGAPFSLMPPAGALPGRGGVEVALSDSPTPSLSGVRAYMSAYPFTCFEQRLSKAVALDDKAAWARQMDELPGYMTQDGLLRYWPSQQLSGSIALTAYALSITADAGYPWPDERRERLLEAMKAVVNGRLTDDNEGPSDMRLLRMQALAALARNGQATAEMIGQVAIPVADMPTAMLADWLITLDHVKGAPPQRRAAAEAALRGRIVYEGTRLDIVDKARSPWWMMVSDDEMAMKALLAAIGRRGWEADAPRMMIGVALRQQRGHWDTTPANAWGSVAARRFDAAYPRAAAGTTTGRLLTQTFTRAWLPSLPGKAPARPEPMLFALPARPSPLLLSHSAAPNPWATITIKAAVPLTAPAFEGYRIARTVSFLERKQMDRLSAGDVLKVRIEVDAPVDRTWVVVEDPIPSGASVISGSGGQSSLLAAQGRGGEGWWPSYIERSNEAWRAYYGWLPKGRTSVEYVLRVNNSGRFQLPPTRVEAMYSPEIHAALPNRTLVVAP
ncbi:alpha-2-macroglobulin [Sphingosinicella sp. BN140058]|uniref:alpha-2-macroglobulin family protein n=1 Tax=Sphingosinicella sp. BN140058 TaxID=1892855 RepID=UPI0010118AE0|nr:MG2 domain-containing protein [Sphingosinicella sp. BN140058]QAY75304.1 alpha-2-macroglobulin [Sphingosinicella sp. BN140058]